MPTWQTRFMKSHRFTVCNKGYYIVHLKINIALLQTRHMMSYSHVVCKKSMTVGKRRHYCV